MSVISRLFVYVNFQHNVQRNAMSAYCQNIPIKMEKRDLMIQVFYKHLHI